MANYHEGKVTERVFDAVKLLLESGSPQAEVARYMKLTKEVVGMINRSETYMDYKALMYERGERHRQRRAIAAKEAEKKKAEAANVAEQVGAVPAVQIQPPAQMKPVSMTVQATHYMETKLDVMIDLLKVMNNKLGAIIDDLYGTGCKKEADQA